MVLHKNYWTKNLQVMENESYNYIVLNSKHLQFQKDITPFEKGVEVWNLINCLRMINTFYKDLNIKKEFDTSILYLVLQAIEKDQAFSLAQLKEYFKLVVEIEEFAKAIQVLSEELGENLYVSSDVGMVLIGFSLSQQQRLKDINDNRFGCLGDDFFKLTSEVEKGNLNVSDYAKKALSLCETVIKEEEDLRAKKEITAG